MSELQELYRELILDHSKRPHGFGLVEGAAAQSHQLNPTCGDEVTLQLSVDGDTVSGITWEGHGCAISQASASLLSQLVDSSEHDGLSLDDLTLRIDTLREALRSRGQIEPDEDLLGDAAVLGGVSRYTARVKCAMLAWVAAEHTVAQVRAGA